MTPYLWLKMTATDLEAEVMQLREEGRDLSSLRSEIDALREADWDAVETQARFAALMDAGQALPFLVAPDHEPNDLERIRDLRPAPVTLVPIAPNIEDRIHGGWLGRISGCLLGKPIEGFRSPDVYPILERSGNWPLHRYLRSDEGWETLPGYTPWHGAAFVDRIDGAPVDDDINYTTTGLAIVQQYERGFTSDDVAEFWVTNIPALQTCTAERVAYKNLLLGLAPPDSAGFRNPYREWIGAQIRADFWDYINPGQPELAAEMAWRDARVSHVRNGIYGEMWAAATIAAAFATDDVTTALGAGLAQIPAECRLSRDLREVMSWHQEGFPTRR
jgi:hypothetical protein